MTAVKNLVEYRPVVESSSNPKSGISLITKGKVANFWGEMRFHFILLTPFVAVPQTVVSKFMNVLLPEQQQLQLRTTARSLFLNATKDQKVLLEETDPADTTDLSKIKKPTILVLSETKNPACFVYEANFCNLNKVYRVVSEKEQMTLVVMLPSKFSTKEKTKY